MPVDRAEQLRSSHWPPEDLEAVSNCPVCSGNDRSLLHDGLWDSTALAAPGRWSLWRCTHCGCAYMDPRPTRESIGRAYETYYTHEEGPPPVASTPSPLRLLRIKLGNGYRNRRYGTNTQPAASSGAMLGLVFPPLRRASDYEFRYLPRARNPDPKVLDVGCGGGHWLSRAAETGWKTCGADPDPRAVEVARANGLDVREGGIEAWSDARGEFDVVTMNHVIEHVHDPRQLLSSARDLLRPGGQLFVETPNIDALSHSAFGRAWRGLEPPRHLILFNRKSLIRLLREVGFESVRQHLAPWQVKLMIGESRRLKALDPETRDAPDGAQGRERSMRLRSAYTRSRAEFLTLTGTRPRS